MIRGITKALLATAMLLAFGATLIHAQDSTIKVRVSPPEAYIFVDGQPFAHRSQTITLPAGQHMIGVYNYGFVPKVETFRLEPGVNPEFVARLEPLPETVKGPWGRLQIEGNVNDKAAVFINGIKPEYFVGHVDEMNNEKIATQKLVLPIGTYELFIVNPKESTPFFTDKIEIRNNERLVIDVATGAHVYHHWTKAGHHEALQRFDTGANTASIAVAPVTGTFSVDKTAIKCGETVRLTWTSKEAADTTIAASPGEPVPFSGQRIESPTQTTTYTFEAKGPGGVVTQSQTVHVDPTVQTSLAASPIEVHYRRIDDKVINPGTTTLSWKAENAQNASIEPVGLVATSGEQQVPAAPRKTDIGPVDEMAVYTLMASNNCGGSDKSLAAVHVTGTIEPLPVVPLGSIFFPTAFPTVQHPEIGLLKGEQEKLQVAVEGFNKFLEYDPQSKVAIIAFADPRSPEGYNLALSERRAELIKAHLIALGVDENRILVEFKGETMPLTREEVMALESAESVPTSLVNAYNRRVDLMMIPTEKPQQKSEIKYPHMMKGERLLRSDARPSLHSVKKASEILSGAAAPGEE